MRKGTRSLSALIAFSMCLTINAYARAEAPVPSGDESPTPSAYTAEAAVSPAPSADAAPPADTGEPDSALTDASVLPPSSYTSLTGCPPQENAGPITIGTEVAGRREIVLNESVAGDGYTAVYASGPQADARVTGEASLSNGADAGGAFFPTGRGAALAAHDGAKMAVENARITVDGPSRTDLTVSDGASVTVRDSEIAALSGDPRANGGEGYANMPADGVMTAPSWGLGVNGSSRAIGLLGRAPSLSLVNTGVAATGWSVLTADGESASISAVDSTLHIFSEAEGGLRAGGDILGYKKSAYGSGCGAYLSGGASQYLYGSAVDGATYGVVLNGADQVYCGPSDGTILLYDGDRLAGSVRGQGQPTRIRSVFGFLMNGDVTDGVTVDGRTRVETAEATVLYKSGSGAFSFNNAVLRPENGVLFQMMDDDDDGRIGLLSGAYGYSPVYDERDEKAPGFPGFSDDGRTAEESAPDPEAAAPARDGSALPDPEPPKAQPEMVSAAYANGLYSGSIYNGTGYYGQPGDALTVTVGRGAVLDGDISLTSSVKAIPYSPKAVQALSGCDGVQYVFLDDAGMPCEEDRAAYIRFLRYTVDQYFLQGHVQDLPCYNGEASLSVTVSQGGVWAVKDVSVVTELTVEDGGLVYGQITDNGDGSVTLCPDGGTLEPGVYVSDPEAALSAMAEAPSQTDDAQLPARITVTVGGREYSLDLHDFDGEEYIRLADLVLLFLGGGRSPGI